jgi:hypothetical protein
MHEISPRQRAGITLPANGIAGAPTRFETRTVVLPSTIGRGDVRRALTAEAESGSWELRRLVVYRGGARTAWLRRRVLRVEATLDERR